jgi:hypothetical protein
MGTEDGGLSVELILTGGTSRAVGGCIFAKVCQFLHDSLLCHLLCLVVGNYNLCQRKLFKLQKR